MEMIRSVKIKHDFLRIKLEEFGFPIFSLSIRIRIKDFALDLKQTKLTLSKYCRDLAINALCIAQKRIFAGSQKKFDQHSLPTYYN